MKSRNGVQLGAQEPRVRLAPHAAANSWEDAVELAAAYGMVADEWQEDVLEGALAERKGGMWSAPRVGLAVPRQNGKNAILEIRELAGLLLFGERLIIHSAHEVKTAMEAFRRVRGYFENFDDLRKKVRRVLQTNGQEGIELTDGRALRFLARSKGSGRGFSADCLILDEAQELSDDTFAAIMPTTSARENRQIWLTGTPPAPSMRGEVFTRFRDAGLSGKDNRLFWAEWSCEPGVDLDDPRAWAQANPALGIRIEPDTIADERAAMDDETFARERLGMWDGSASLAVIDAQSWARVADMMSQPDQRLALAVDVTPDRTSGSVSVAGQRRDELWHVELVDNRNGVGWIVDRVAGIFERQDIRAVIIDAASPAGSLIDPLETRGVKVTKTNARQMAAACGGFYDAVMENTLRHIDQPLLNAALGAARKRALGDAWAWHRKTAGADITPLVSATLALFGAQSDSIATIRKRTRQATFV